MRGDLVFEALGGVDARFILEAAPDNTSAPIGVSSNETLAKPPKDRRPLGGWVAAAVCAVVALGVPLYLQLETIKKQLLPILLSQLVGCIVGVVSVVLIARWLGAPQEIIYSLAPKSVTTPIAMEVTKTLGGIPSLTAAVVVCVGLLGGILGMKTMQITHIGSPMAQGLSLGTAAHAVGTSTAMDISSKYGAFASLGLTLNGILTALLTPTILSLLGL